MSVLFYAGVVVVAGAASLTRLLLTNPTALSTLVWAEDGLFPLCIAHHGYLPCLVDPFAGYLLFLSRTLALPVSWFPVDTWPVATNLVAALSVGALAALLAWVLVRSGWSRPIAFVTALVPVVVPIAGFEAVNASGSAYMVLLVVAAALVSLPAVRDINVWVIAAVFLAASLTIPSSVVLVAPLALATLGYSRDWRRFGIAAGSLTAGLAAQAFIVLTADNPRRVAVSVQSLDRWVQGIPTALRTLWPGNVQLGPTGVLEGSSAPLPASGWLLLVCLLVGAGLMAFLGIRYAEPRITGLGLFLGAGLMLGAVPAIAGFANNRYYVIPTTVFAMVVALLIGMITRVNSLVLAGGLVVAMLLVWTSGFPAGDYRSQASPEWKGMLAEVRSVCDSGAVDVALTFSPNWPFSDAVFPGVTSQRVPCEWLTDRYSRRDEG